MNGVVELQAFHLSTFECDWSRCLPCFTKGQNSAPALFAGITGDVNLVISRLLVVNGCEAVLAEDKVLIALNMVWCSTVQTGNVLLHSFLVKGVSMCAQQGWGGRH